MQTIRPKTIGIAGVDPVHELIKTGLDRMNRIREGILQAAQNAKLAPFQLYRIANELDSVAMYEYQNFHLEHTAALIEDRTYETKLNLGNWRNYYNGQPKALCELWQKVIDICVMEKVKILELCRIAPEIRTSALEAFTNAFANFVSEKKNATNESANNGKNTEN